MFLYLATRRELSNDESSSGSINNKMNLVLTMNNHAFKGMRILEVILSELNCVLPLHAIMHFIM